MRRQPAIRQSKVPYLPEKRIERQAQLLLDEWAQDHAPITEPPVPIDEILELHLGLDFAIADLQGQFGQPDVLGAIWFGDRMIKVDQSLDPAGRPKMLGRYRFTLAHEVGHWRLHHQHLKEDPTAQSLFEAGCAPAFVQRSSVNPPEEVQANAFAACVLMPRQLILDAWARWRGTDAAVAISDLPIGDDYDDPKVNEAMAMERFCKPLAEQFEVSAQAMRYRLQRLGLLARQVQHGLF
jgi:hypothetical protein